MGSKSTSPAIPHTIQQLQLSRGQKTKLSHFSLKQLNHFVGNHDGVLERGKNFSLSCIEITAQLVDNDIRLECHARKHDGNMVSASLLLGNVVSKQQVEQIK